MIALFFGSQLTSGVSASPGIRTTSGILHGISNPSYTAFLGIPYAQPPIDNLRWRTALPINTPAIKVNATRFGPACVQLVIPGNPPYAFGKIIPIPSIQSEDCLFLNVWAPLHGRNLPVIVFVHGGGFQTGSAEAYSGDHIASTGRAIYVSINYRLNIWGFPSTNAIDGIDQNTGISDARLAIEWVAQNIAQFGGNPEHIIIAGHSGGAALVDAYVYAYQEDPAVVGQILVSGTIGIFDTTPTGGAFWNAVANSLGCGNTTDTSQVCRLDTMNTLYDAYSLDSDILYAQ